MKGLLSIILVIRILCIGNSFSWDAVEQEFVPLCAEEGVEVEVHDLYYGGCSLQQHVQFYYRDTAAYSHRVCSNSEWTNGEWRIIKDTISLKQALQDGEYDYISLQQASHWSGMKVSYEPWLIALVEIVREYQPNARLCWMQTWAYSRDATHPYYPLYHNDQQEMWDSIVQCTNYVQQRCRTYHEDILIIPCGTAIQNARQTKLGDTLCRDGYHLNYIYGRYTAAAVWYEMITGRDVRRNRYKNAQMTNRQRRLTQKSAHKAVKNAQNALF